MHEHGKGAALFGYTRLYGSVPGGQAEYLRVPQGHYGPIKVPEGPPDERFLYLSDVIPTAWQAVEYADVPERRHARDLRARSRRSRCACGSQSISVSNVSSASISSRSAATWRADMEQRRSTGPTLSQRSSWRQRADGVRTRCIDAVGTEAHGAPVQELMQKVASRSPARLATALMERVGSDRTSALHTAIASVRRGGTLSIIGVYGGAATPMPMMDLFDKQIQIRMGQANVKSWIDTIMPLVTDDADPLGTEDWPRTESRSTTLPRRTSSFRRRKTARSRSCSRHSHSQWQLEPSRVIAAGGRPLTQPRVGADDV